MTFGWRPHYSREWLDYIEKIGQLNVLFKGGLWTLFTAYCLSIIKENLSNFLVSSLNKKLCCIMFFYILATSYPVCCLILALVSRGWIVKYVAWKVTLLHHQAVVKATTGLWEKNVECTTAHVCATHPNKLRLKTCYKILFLKFHETLPKM